MLPGSWRSMFKLNCCTMPCLKFGFCETIPPVKESGFGGAVMGLTGPGGLPMDGPSVKPYLSPQALAALCGRNPLPNGQVANGKVSISAKYGGFCQSP